MTEPQEYIDGANIEQAREGLRRTVETMRERLRAVNAVAGHADDEHPAGRPLRPAPAGARWAGEPYLVEVRDVAAVLGDTECREAIEEVAARGAPLGVVVELRGPADRGTAEGRELRASAAVRAAVRDGRAVRWVIEAPPGRPGRPANRAAVVAYAAALAGRVEQALAANDAPALVALFAEVRADAEVVDQADDIARRMLAEALRAAATRIDRRPGGPAGQGNGQGGDRPGGGGRAAADTRGATT